MTQQSWAMWFNVEDAMPSRISHSKRKEKKKRKRFTKAGGAEKASKSCTLTSHLEVLVPTLATSLPSQLLAKMLGGSRRWF